MTRNLLILVTIATILNGIGYWLNLVGFTNNDRYQDIIIKKQHINDQNLFFYENPDLRSEDSEIKLKTEYKEYKNQLFHHVYAPLPPHVLLKTVKYFVTVLFILSCIYLSIKSNNVSLGSHQITILILLASASIYTFYLYGWQPVAAGLNLYLITFIALYSNLENDDLEFLSKCLLVTIGILLFMIPIELSRALEVFNTQSLFKIRMSGFMIQPNTLGVYVVCVYSLYLTYCQTWQNGILFAFFTLATLVLIVLSGSMTASITFLVVVLIYSIEKCSEISPSRIWFLFWLVLIVSSLYFFEGRDSLQSLQSRFDKFSYYFSNDLQLLDYFIGQGIGIGTNSLLQIQNWIPFSNFSKIPIKFSADSTPLLLIIQVGFFGFFVFYGSLLKSMVKNKKLRLMYLTIILCSLSINIIEIFPLNILIGIMLIGERNKNISSTA